MKLPILVIFPVLLQFSPALLLLLLLPSILLSFSLTFVSLSSLSLVVGWGRKWGETYGYALVIHTA